MDINIKNIEIFLNKKPTNAISITNPNNSEILERNIDMVHINEYHKSIEKFFLYVKLNHQIDVIFVQKKRANGSRKINFEAPILLKLTVPSNKPLEGVATNGSPVHPVVEPNVANSQYPMQKTYNPEVMNQNTQAVGLNAVQIANGIIAEKEAATLKEKIADLKEDLKEQKSKTKKKESKIEELVAKLRDAEAELKNFETKMGLEILKIQIEKQPILTPEMVEMFSNLSPALVALLTPKGAVAPQQTAGLGASLENLSEIKKLLVNIISAPDFLDDNARTLNAVIGGFDNPQYTAELQQLQIKYNIN
jgi:hypothetical protein